jgi:hypothetical protein
VDFVAPFAKVAHHMTADEPGSPGDEDPHRGQAYPGAA